MNEVNQGVGGSGNQSSGSADSMSQVVNDYSISLELHLSLPSNYKIFSAHALHVTITLESREEKP